jgi:antitoxin ParD1/3/4
MATDITTINISLPKRLRADVERKVQRDSYGSVSEYVRDLIRRDLRGRAVDEVDTLLLEGLSSGEPVPVRRGFWKKLKTEATKTRRRA